MTKSATKKHPQAKFAITHDTGVDILIKDKTANVLRPLSVADKMKYYPTVNGASKKELARILDLSADEDVIRLDHKTMAAEAKKITQTAERDKLEHAVSLIKSIPELNAQPTTITSIFLLALFGQISDLTYRILPELPHYTLGQLSTLPWILPLVLLIVNGPTRAGGENWDAARPSVLTPQRTLRRQAVSTDVRAYIGGSIRNWAGKHKVWLPLHRRATVFAPGVPKNVEDAIRQTSADIIRIECTKDKSAIRLNGEELYAVDEDLAAEISEYAMLLAAMMNRFFNYLRKSMRGDVICFSHIDEYLPRTRKGRFTATTESPHHIALATGMFVLDEFLLYAQEKLWISESAAQEILAKIWEVALPESAPHSSVSNELLPKDCAYEHVTLDTFWQLLYNFILTNLNQLVPKPRISAAAMACLHPIRDTIYLIIPRDKLAVYCADSSSAFRDYIQGSLTQDDNPPANQGLKLNRWLVNECALPLKTEGADLGWRFSFYPSSDSTKKPNEKIHCLAFPITCLPRNLQQLLSQQLGIEFNDYAIPDIDRSSAKGQAVIGGDKEG